MRIVCDNCSTKYSISDDKVRGKVFKIRCKNCSHVIIVRGDGVGAVEESAPAAAAAAEGVWYIVRGGQQDGPYTVEDIEGFIAAGEVTSETYTWREGFGDWVPLASAEGLNQLLAAPAPVQVALPEQSYHDEGMISDQGPSSDFDDEIDATKVVDSSSFQAADLEQSAQMDNAAVPADDPHRVVPEDATVPVSLVGGGLVSGMSAEPEPAFDESPSFSGLSAGSSSLDAAFSQEPVSQPSAPSNGVQIQNQQFVGSRNEDSVLFSLNSLASTNDEQIPEHTNTEASGLIDIRALQASNAAVSGGRDGNANAMNALAGGGGSAPEPAIPVPAMMPMGTRKSNWPLYTAIGGVFLLVLLLGFAVVGLFVFKGGEDDAGEAAVASSDIQGEANGDEGALKGAIADKGSAKADKAEGTEGTEGKGAGGETPEGEKPEGDEADDSEADSEGEETDDAAEDDGDSEENEDKKGDAAETVVAKAERPGIKDKPKSRADKAKEREAREKRVADKAKDKKPEAPAKEAKRGGNNKDAIDDILSDIGGKKKPAEEKKVAKPAADTAGAKKSLGKSEVQRVIRGAYGRVSACNANQADKKSGTVTVRFTIQPSGSVGGAQVTGGFAGTPVGGCISRVVRSLRFPRFDGRPLTITFPFRLR
jgi:predicted Zn finger-like uncharacterized protein